MASPDQVRQYLAYWFQLGKRVFVNSGHEALLPNPVLQGDRYSPQFEACWQRLVAPHAGDSYLEGTSQTIAELLSSAWDIHPCARCEMPVPTPDLGILTANCPCADLSFWPDTEKPRPRAPINNQEQLTHIRDRLLQVGQQKSATTSNDGTTAHCGSEPPDDLRGAQDVHHGSSRSL